MRAKTLPANAFLALCDDVVRAADSFGATVIVNDRVDLALVSGAHGAHVGQDDLPAAAARRLLGPGAIVGLSTHTSEQIANALTQPVTYIAVGPVFGTTTKSTGYDAVGLDLVATATQAANGIPVVAIGGITLERAPAVLDAGATMVAVIGDLLVGDPAVRAAAFVRALSRAR